jgi:hypothetical protein
VYFEHLIAELKKNQKQGYEKTWTSPRKPKNDCSFSVSVADIG